VAHERKEIHGHLKAGREKDVQDGSVPHVSQQVVHEEPLGLHLGRHPLLQGSEMHLSPAAPRAVRKLPSADAAASAATTTNRKVTHATTVEQCLRGTQLEHFPVREPVRSLGELQFVVVLLVVLLIIVVAAVTSNLQRVRRGGCG
jgi:hypothetical protein